MLRYNIYKKQTGQYYDSIYKKLTKKILCKLNKRNHEGKKSWTNKTKINYKQNSDNKDNNNNEQTIVVIINNTL